MRNLAVWRSVFTEKSRPLKIHSGRMPVFEEDMIMKKGRDVADEISCVGHRI